MRLGQIKNILDGAIDENNHLIYKFEALYGGNRYLVHSFGELMTALEVLQDQPWLFDTKEVFASISEDYMGEFGDVEITPEAHQSLNALVQKINAKLPMFYGILETYTTEQQDQLVNIQLPTASVGDLQKLNKFNSEIEELFKLIVLHKGFRANSVEFIGFDTGTSWYQLLIVGAPIAYYGFLGVIEVAEKLINLRSDYYTSEKIRLGYELEKKKLKSEKKKKENSFDDYIDEIIELKKIEEIEGLLQKLKESLESVNESLPNEKEEMSISLTKGLDLAIKMMKFGTEFHPSLSSSEIIEFGGDQTTFHIDYDNISKVIEQSNEVDQPQIENQDGSKNETGNSSEKDTE